MLLLAVTALVPLVVAATVALVALRWPRTDPAAPSGRGVSEELAEHPEAAQGARRVLRPAGTTALGLSAAALAAAACGVAFGVLFLLVRSRGAVTGMDGTAAQWAADHATPASSAVLRAVTYLGSVVVALPLVVAVGVVEARRVPNRSLPGFLVLVEAGQLLLAYVVKVLVDRARPAVNPLADFSAPSFPSAHATTAAATFAALALLLGRRRGLTTRAALAGAAAGLTALVASSRVLLGVHWVTDVVAGAALGWGWAAACSIAFGGRLLRFGAPVEEPATISASGGPAERLAS